MTSPKELEEVEPVFGGGNNSTTEEPTEDEGKSRDKAASLVQTNARYIQDSRTLSVSRHNFSNFYTR